MRRSSLRRRFHTRSRRAKQRIQANNVSRQLPVVSCQLSRLKVGLQTIGGLGLLHFADCIGAENMPGATNSRANARLEINSALRDSAHIVSTSNMLGSLHEPE